MPISRKKSCVPCRAAKARCDLATVCSRCSERGLQCKYSDKGLSLSGPHILPHAETSHLDESGETAMHGIELSRDVDQDSAALTIEDIGWPTPGWNNSEFLQSSVDDLTLGAFGEILAQQSHIGTLTQSSTEYSQMQTPPVRGISKDRQHRLPSDGQTRCSQEAEDRLEVISGGAYRNIFSPRKSTTTQSFLTARVIWGKFMTYPKMLIQGHLPPFIYPSCVFNDVLPQNCTVNGIHQCLPEALAVCAGLVIMFESRTPASSSFVWRSIDTEVKRLKNSVIPKHVFKN